MQQFYPHGMICRRLCAVRPYHRAMSAVYRLENASGTIIAGQVAVADNVLSRFMGLMFRKELLPGHGLAIRPCNSIHMFFMRFPLDVVFVDGDGRVVRVLDSIRPWRASSFVRGAKAAIELPAGTAARSVVVPGAVLRLVEAAGVADDVAR
jgi:uncharacterized membrane protein (UPF0127 family)